MTAFSSRRVRAIFAKDLREFRRNRSLTVGMGILPVAFSIQPLVAVLTLTPIIQRSPRAEG